MASGFSLTIIDVWRWWSEIVKVLKENSFQLRIFYSDKISIKYENKVCKNSESFSFTLSEDVAWGHLEQTENENQERYSCDFKKNAAERGRCVFKKKDVINSKQ